LTGPEIMASTRCPRCGAAPGQVCVDDGRWRHGLPARHRGLGESMEVCKRPGTSPLAAAGRLRRHRARCGRWRLAGRVGTGPRPGRTGHKIRGDALETRGACLPRIRGPPFPWPRRDLIIARVVSISSMEPTSDCRSHDRPGAATQAVGPRQASDPAPWAAAEEPTACLLSRASYLLSSKGFAKCGPRVQFPPTAAPRFRVPASCPRSTVRRPNADDSFHFGAARFGRIDRSVERSPCARRCRRTEASNECLETSQNRSRLHRPTAAAKIAATARAAPAARALR
jgi:hypothetical protein